MIPIDILDIKYIKYYYFIRYQNASKHQDEESFLTIIFGYFYNKKNLTQILYKKSNMCMNSNIINNRTEKSIHD